MTKYIPAYVALAFLLAMVIMTGAVTLVNHNLLSATHIDTSTHNVQRGDIITGQTASGSTTWAASTLGASGSFLMSDGLDVLWQAAGAGSVGISFPIPEASVSNLVSDLAGKQPSFSALSEASITNLVSDLANKQNIFTSLPEATITGLVSDLASKATSSAYTGSSTITDVGALKSGSIATGFTSIGYSFNSTRTSAQEAALITDETGTGVFVMSRNPSLTNPSLSDSVASTGSTGAMMVANGAGGFKYLGTKIIYATRDLSAASGSVSYTGVGFKPSSILAIAAINTTAQRVIGLVDSAMLGSDLNSDSNNVTQVGGVFVRQFVGTYTDYNYQDFTITSYDSDGFTGTWTKAGSPTGTLTISFLCFP